MPRSILSRATDAVANRLDRRSFIARSALVGSALVTAPADLLLRPTSAYAALCSCTGQSCDCGSLCCDGYTEFCCALYGYNTCPAGSLIGGWWKADGSSFCGGAARYYMDCHKPCGTCTCGTSGVCSGACNGTACGCGLGRCDYRRAGCNAFRYGNCNNAQACIGPIQCRVVSCTAPWAIDSTCSSTDVRTDNNTALHNRTCLQTVPPIYPVTGDWDGDGKQGIGFYNNTTAEWTLRQTGMTLPIPVFHYGRTAGDRPVTGDWDGDGKVTVGIVRGTQWHLSNTINPAAASYITQPWGATTDIPVAGDWNGDGVDCPGRFRAGGYWYLSHTTEPVTALEIRYGTQVGDIPVVGDWDDDGVDGIGVFRKGYWFLNDSLKSSTTSRIIQYGQPGDIPVVGDWHHLGRVSIGVYRPSQGRWYLRQTLDDNITLSFAFGQAWTIG